MSDRVRTVSTRREGRERGASGPASQDEVAGKGGEPFSVFSVRIEKRYKDATGNWQSTTRFKRGDLADLELVVFKAREFVSLNEREPSEQTG